MGSVSLLLWRFLSSKVFSQHLNSWKSLLDVLTIPRFTKCFPSPHPKSYLTRQREESTHSPAKFESIHFSLTHPSLLCKIGTTFLCHVFFPPNMRPGDSLSSTRKPYLRGPFLFTALSNSILLQITHDLPLGIKASHIFFALVQRLGLGGCRP